MRGGGGLEDRRPHLVAVGVPPGRDVGWVPKAGEAVASLVMHERELRYTVMSRRKIALAAAR
jgi:hypothetical protein